MSITLSLKGEGVCWLGFVVERMGPFAAVGVIYESGRRTFLPHPSPLPLGEGAR